MPYGSVRRLLGLVFHELAGQRELKIIEGIMVQDHIHRMIKIPFKYSVAEAVGYIKGKSAIVVLGQFGEGQRNLNGEKLWLEAMLYQQLGLKKLKFKLI